MPTIKYRSKRGKQLQGITTVKSQQIGWGKGGLMGWANKVGRGCGWFDLIEDIGRCPSCGGPIREIYLEEIERTISLCRGMNLNEARNTATIPGTIAHLLIESFLKQEEPDLSEYSKEDIEKAMAAFDNFKMWAKQFEFEPIAIEPHLISEMYQCGGTPDVIARVLGKASIVDWKTGGIYEDLFVQLRFYKQAWEENHPNVPITGGYHVLRIPRDQDTPRFHHSHWATLPQEAWDAVQYALALRKC